MLRDTIALKGGDCMRLNPDCIRDILLSVEEKSDGMNSVTIDRDMFPRLERYTTGEIYYHVRQSADANLLSDMKEDLIGNCRVRDLTPIGHEFIANIRKDSLWERTKDTAKMIGSNSLKAIVQIASNVVAEVIKAKFSG